MVLIGVHGQEHPDNIKDQLCGFFEKFLGNNWIHACKEKMKMMTWKMGEEITPYLYGCRTRPKNGL